MKPLAISLSCILGLGLLVLQPALIQAQATPLPEHKAEHVKTVTPASTSLAVTVDGKTTTLSVSDLQSMPQKTVTVHNAHNNADETYSGVYLGDLLAKCGFAASKATQQKMLRSYVVAEGMDKYWVLYSATEVEASEHAGDVIIATSMGGKPLGDDGQFRLISTEDKKPQRWVRNLTAITLKTAE